jgi:hypothetical protein
MSLDKINILEQVRAKGSNCRFQDRYVRPWKELRTCLLTAYLSETRQHLGTLLHSQTIVFSLLCILGCRLSSGVV